MPSVDFLRAGCVLLLTFGALTVGCENTIDPYSGRGSYSVYGALSLHQNRQFVRVKPLRSPIVSDSTSPLPATVTLKNQSTGATTTLQDSIIIFGDATVTHNYWADLKIEPKTEYQLTVEGPRGKAQATTLTPTNTKATITPSGNTPGPPTDTVRVDADTLHCLTTFEVRLRDAKVPYRASVGLSYQGSVLWVDQQVEQPSDGDEKLYFTPNNLLAQHLHELYEEPPDDPETCRYRENWCKYLSTGKLVVTYTYIGPQWFGSRPAESSGSEFDPTESREIQGGLGFFGSYFRNRLSVTIHRGVIDLGPDACSPF